MKFNSMLESMIDPRLSDTVTSGDLTDFHRNVLDSGWVEEDHGAWVLRTLRGSYYGAKGQFSDVTGYEASVNGRAIPDLDLDSAGSRRAETLFRRGYSFAHSALFSLSRIQESPSAVAYITIGPTLYDETVIIGNVTFCAIREGVRPYIDDISDVSLSGVLLLDSNDCSKSLPSA
ncbi:hypothetical protein [Nocardiopsis ganjiahuensis]|uniref:hypothetical protein n=1 Tax=Nocardiopsis ganjiahuensis TaxID=239984 RepID=UPI001268AB0B|nr:hypothetical protein [Nocardiopsis ganjiahuensis]